MWVSSSNSSSSSKKSRFWLGNSRSVIDSPIAGRKRRKGQVNLQLLSRVQRLRPETQESRQRHTATSVEKQPYAFVQRVPQVKEPVQMLEQVSFLTWVSKLQS